MGGLREGAWSSPSQETPEEGRHPPSKSPFSLQSKGSLSPHHPVTVKGSMGVGGRDNPGGREPSLPQLPPKGSGGGRAG